MQDLRARPSAKRSSRSRPRAVAGTFAAALALASASTSAVTSSGCMITIVQSHADLSPLENADMSLAHHSPSNGITPKSMTPPRA